MKDQRASAFVTEKKHEQDSHTVTCIILSQTWTHHLVSAALLLVVATTAVAIEFAVVVTS